MSGTVLGSGDTGDVGRMCLPTVVFRSGSYVTVNPALTKGT